MNVVMNDLLVPLFAKNILLLTTRIRFLLKKKKVFLRHAMLIARPRVYKIFLKKCPLNINKRYVKKKKIYFSLRERYHLLKSCMYAFDPNRFIQNWLPFIPNTSRCLLEEEHEFPQVHEEA